MTKEQYLIFLSRIYTTKQGKPLSPSSVKHYGDEALRKINEFTRLIHPEYDSIFDVSSLSELEILKKEIFTNQEFIDLDGRGNNMYSAGFNRYFEFASGQLLLHKEASLSLLDTKEPVRYSSIVSDRYIPTRDRIKIIQAEQASNYNCQIDIRHRSFTSQATHRQYVEGHHIIPLNQQKDFQFSLDCYANILVLCPNCHRFLHYGLEREKREKLSIIYEERAERLHNSGIELDRKEFLERVTPSRLYASF